MEVWHSLREAARCLGIEGDHSTVRDFYGYLVGIPTGVQLSLRAQLIALSDAELPPQALAHALAILEALEAVEPFSSVPDYFKPSLRRRHIHLDMIQVAAEQFEQADYAAIDRAVQRTRETFAPLGLGVGRVAHFGISADEADGLEIIAEREDAKKLTRRWRGPHDDAIDAFFVRQYHVDNANGQCRIDLPCNKDLRVHSGCVIGMNGIFPNLLPHELGHGLGLEHVGASGNFMNATIRNNLVALEQGLTMRKHCFTQAGCS